MRLDSITFTLAENNFHLQPFVHQSEQAVYDTTVQGLPSKVYQRYMYFQVPVMAGYELFNYPNFTAGLRAGPVFSVLLNSDPKGADYSLGEDMLVGVEQLTTDRVKINWQLSAGLNFTFRWPEGMSVEIEPQASYYFRALHQQTDNTKHPYSVGLRVAVGIK